MLVTHAAPRIVSLVLLTHLGCAELGDGPQAAGSDSMTGSAGASDDAEQADIYDEARQDCVDAINRFRSTEGKPALIRWRDAERCTDEQGQKDGASGVAHQHFGDCHEFAQNTCPGWPSTADVVQDCLQAMWDEGPGEPFSEHGHYLNMSSTEYTQVACGFSELANGSIWANQNFR